MFINLRERYKHKTSHLLKTKHTRRPQKPSHVKVKPEALETIQYQISLSNTKYQIPTCFGLWSKTKLNFT